MAEDPSRLDGSKGELAAEADSQTADSSLRRTLRWIPWLMLVAVCMAALAARQNAANSDHALINIAVAGLSFLGWLILLGALWSSRSLRGWAKFVAVAPLLAGIIFAVLFRFERLDSELVPQFRPRWQPPEELPNQTAGSPGSPQDPFFAATDHDFNQFLGPRRDARLEFALDADWENNPPKILWKQPIGEGWSGFATQGELAVTMEQRDQSEWVSAYSILDGQLLWKYEIPARHTTVPGGTGPRSTPLIANNKVYACSAVSAVVCLELASGKEIWRQELLEIAATDQSSFESSVTWGRSGSPMALDNLLIAPFGGEPGSAQPLIALNMDDGQVVWQAGSGQISYSSPMLANLDGRSQILMVSENKLAAYDPDNGNVLWEVPWPGNSNSNPAVPQPLIVDSNRVLLCKGYGEGSMLIEVRYGEESWNLQTLWKNTSVMKSKFSNPVLHQGHVYGLSDGILECVRLEDGERQWKRGRYRHGQVLLLNDLLLILSEAGELVVVPAQPDRFEELASMPVISDVSWNNLALSGDRLLIRNSEQAACVQLPQLSTPKQPPASEQPQPLGAL